MKSYLYLFLSLLLLACQSSYKIDYSMAVEGQKYTVQTSVATDVAQKVQRLKASLQWVLLEKFSLIWNDYRWQDYQILLVNSSKPVSYLWPIGKELLAVKTKELPAQAEGLYENLHINGRQTLVLQLEGTAIDSVEQLAAMTTAELFRAFVQQNWNFNYQHGPIYPRQTGSRLYPRMIYKALIAYWQSVGTEGESPAVQSLGQARYWYDRWQKELPYQIERTAVAVLGGAFYVEMMAQAILDWEAKAKALNETNIEKHLQSQRERFDTFMNPEQFSPDIEGHGLGALAVTLLRFGTVRPELNLKDWNDWIAEGQEPLAILLDNVAPIAQEPDALLQAKLEKSSEKKNQTLAPTYDVLMAQWLDTANYVRVRFPALFLYQHGSYRPSDGSYLQAIGQRAMQMAESYTLASTTGGKTKLELDKGFITQDNSFIVMLKRSLFQQTDQSQTLTVSYADSEGFINGTLQGKLQPKGEISYFIAE